MCNAGIGGVGRREQHSLTCLVKSEKELEVLTQSGAEYVED